MFLYILSMSFSSVRYNFKWLRCLFQWSYEPDPHLGWLLLAKWKEHSARACVVWALNITQISEGSENKRVCFILCGSHLMSLDGRRSWVRLREAGGNPVPFPPRRHSFWGDYFPPKLSLTPAKITRGWRTRDPFHLTEDPLQDSKIHHRGGAGTELYLLGGREQGRLLNQRGGQQRAHQRRYVLRQAVLHCPFLWDVPRQ